MAKARSASFRCTECAWTSAKWVGRCGECQAWGTDAEVSTTATATGLKSRTSGVAPTRRARPVSEIAEETVARASTGLGEFDRVIGGGLVPGQVVLLAHGAEATGRSAAGSASSSAAAARPSTADAAASTAISSRHQRSQRKPAKRPKAHHSTA